ncbi:MAG: TetR/AcrR family transcriptional regulator [Atopobiaceae bacterium]|nr:TetR/AcrR family transcriptional regulator [Atopobiaceae bacterium]
MSGKDFDTRAALVRSGRQEFLEHGFRDASLRAICKRANVTTGAFYVHFKNKEALFASIVEADLGDYLDLYDGMLARLTAKVQQANDNEVAIMEYLMDHRDLFRLLFDCSEGTRYEGFKERLIHKFEDSYQAFFEAYACVPVDHEVTKTLVQMKFAQYCSMLFGDYSKEQALQITGRLQTFTRAGLAALLHTDFGSSG